MTTMSQICNLEFSNLLLHVDVLQTGNFDSMITFFNLDEACAYKLV